MKTRPVALSAARFLVAGLLLTGSACALPRGGTRGPWDEPGAARPVRLNVTNNYNGSMTIYAVGSGTIYRMGTVLPGFAGQFVVRQTMIGNGVVEFVAQATRQAPVRSDRLLLIPGDEVDFEIGANLVHSNATVRPTRR